jgi:metallo-beta-lactamase class B
MRRTSGPSRLSSRVFLFPRIFFKIQPTIAQLLSMRLRREQWLAHVVSRYPNQSHGHSTGLNYERAAIFRRTISVKRSFSCFILLATSSTLLAQADAKSRAWNQPVPPFRILGNLYYVGATEVASFLITTPEGHFLLDGGFAETAPQIERNIAQLGFNLRDVKMLLNSHAHLDHAGGLAELKKLTGASLIAMAADVELLEHGGHADFRFGDTLAFPPVKVDRFIHDGESIELGGQKMIARLTAGHTKGNTTWTTQITDNGKRYDVVFAGSVTTLDYRLSGRESYVGIAADFKKTFAILKQLPCDVFLSDHGSFFSFKEKRERLVRGEKPNPFIDPAGYIQFVTNYEKEFSDKLQQQSRETPASP